MDKNGDAMNQNVSNNRGARQAQIALDTMQKQMKCLERKVQFLLTPVQPKSMETRHEETSPDSQRAKGKASTSKANAQKSKRPAQASGTTTNDDKLLVLGQYGNTCRKGLAMSACQRPN